MRIFQKKANNAHPRVELNSDPRDRHEAVKLDIVTQWVSAVTSAIPTSEG